MKYILDIEFFTDNSNINGSFVNENHNKLFMQII